MKGNMLAFCAVFFAVGLMLNGCVVVKEYAPQKEVVEVSKQEYQLARQLLQAFVKNDAKGFVAANLRKCPDSRCSGYGAGKCGYHYCPSDTGGYRVYRS